MSQTKDLTKLATLLGLEQLVKDACIQLPNMMKAARWESADAYAELITEAYTRLRKLSRET